MGNGRLRLTLARNCSGRDFEFFKCKGLPVPKRRWSRTASSAKIEVLSLQSEQEGKSWNSLLRSVLISQRMSLRCACWMCAVRSWSDVFLDATRSRGGQNNCRRCNVAMEACGSAHHWGRWFAARGHTARLIAAEFVVPFRKGGKNDTADAEAIAIAARQPTMRFVPIKTVDQQAILAWHSVREGWKEERTALLNRVRGLLAEFGIVIGRSSDRLLKALPELTEDGRLPDAMRAMLLEAREQFAALHARLARCDAQIAAHARNSPAAQRAE